MTKSQPVTPTNLIRKKDYLADGGTAKFKTRNNSVYSNNDKKSHKRVTSETVNPMSEAITPITTYQM